MEIRKPNAVFRYNKFIKEVDRADQYLLLLSSDENCKMVKKVLLYLLNCVLFNPLECRGH
jgi:hypothetical protein